jgi:hypothetical protein
MRDRRDVRRCEALTRKGGRCKSKAMVSMANYILTHEYRHLLMSTLDSRHTLTRHAVPQGRR